MLPHNYKKLNISYLLFTQIPIIIIERIIERILRDENRTRGAPQDKKRPHSHSIGRVTVS